MTALLAMAAPIWGRVAPYLLAAGPGGILIISIYQTGVRAERKRGEAAALRVKIATLEADIRQARLAAADGAARAAAVEAATATERAGPVLARDLPPAPAALVADRSLPPIRVGMSAVVVAAEQRAAAARERRERLALAGWYETIRRAYRVGR